MVDFNQTISFADKLEILRGISCPEKFIDETIVKLEKEWKKYLKDHSQTIRKIKQERIEWHRDFLFKSLEILSPKEFTSIPGRIDELKSLKRCLRKTDDTLNLDAARMVSIEKLYNFQKARKTRQRLIAVCPFHHEKTPSFSVNLEKNLFYCHGCHEGGDAIKFFMKVSGLPFKEAVLELGKFRT